MLHFPLMTLMIIHLIDSPEATVQDKYPTVFADEEYQDLVPFMPTTVKIKKGERTCTFLINQDCTTAYLYLNVIKKGFMDPTYDANVLRDQNGRIILESGSTKLRDVLKGISSPQIPLEICLEVFAIDQIEITLQITNGDRTAILEANGATIVLDIYKMAVKNGIMDNTDWFVLRDDANGKLLGDDNMELLEVIDVSHPNQLRLSVVAIPEGALLFAMFCDMTPNEQIPFWRYAQLCINNITCGVADGVNYVSKNVIVVDNVPSWTGKLHLKYVPDTVYSMTLKGYIVELDLGDLRSTSLTELVLDFEKVIGINVLGLVGSKLKFLSLPSHEGLRREDVEFILVRLSNLRLMKKISLEVMEFKGGKRIEYDT